MNWKFPEHFDVRVGKVEIYTMTDELLFFF
jgi:hypothetical protein